MNPIYLSSELAIALDLVAWLAIHLWTAWLGSRLPARKLARDSWLCRQRAWEHGGELNARSFGIRRWKHLLPDGASLFPDGFAKRHLRATSSEYLETFIRETRRAELSHWLAVLAVPVFFVWNPWWVGLAMLGYALAANGPCIITQRYNRARLLKVVTQRARVRSSRAREWSAHYAG